MQLEVLSERGNGGDIQEEGSLRDKVSGAGGLGIEVGHESFGEDMDRTDNVSRDHFADVVIFHEEVLGMTWKVGCECGSDGWCGIRLDDGGLRLRKEDPVT